MGAVHPTYLFCAESLVRRLRSHGRGCMRVSRGLLRGLLCLVQQRVHIAPRTISINGASRRYHVVRRCVGTRCTRAVALSALDTLAFRDGCCVTRTFAGCGKVSPVGCLVAEHVRRTGSLLRRASFPITGVTRTINFSSRSCFSRTFHQRAALSPSTCHERFLS